MSIEGSLAHRVGVRGRRAAPRSAIGLGLGAVSVLLFVASVFLSPPAHQSAVQYFWLVPYGLVGMAIAYRQPGNAIGWILLATSIVTLLCSDAGIYAVLIYRDGHRELPLGRVAVVLAAFWAWFLVLLPLPILLFPDGRLPEGRWRLTVWVYAALVGFLLLGSAVGDLGVFTHRVIHVDSTGELTTFDGGPSFAPLVLLYLALAVSWVIYKVGVYRRSTGERRAQLKWLMTGGTLTVVGFVFGISANSSKSPVIKALATLGFLLVLALPISMGVGIFKYRLYEIDRLVSRTLSYAVLSALLVGVFVGLVALTTDVLPFSSSVGVAASTLAAAALFNPLRGWVQRVVDRRFNRARYDAEATVSAFASRLRDAVDLDAVQAELLEVVQRTVEPAHPTLWIRPAQSQADMGQVR
jgi:hypothetical protein